jgi:PPM family protein phosphatase
MRIGESASVSDPGRRRRRNEDSYVLEPPLFAVADGMGGAQAGEVASRLAAAVFREYHDADELDPEARLAAIIQEANRRIYERGQTDREASGMGTTITAALVGDEWIAIGHVGDSRLYRVRSGELEQLTEDHSLVADLMRSGRLTPEEAESHPQRSVITRALGTDPEVDVDTFVVDAEPGDVFLLCSDGLTTMVGHEDILLTLEGSQGLQAAAKALVKAANRGGGEDNITVVLFSLETGEPGEETAVMGNGRGSGEDLEDTLSGLDAAPTIPGPADTVISEPGEPGAVGWVSAPDEGADPPRRKRRALMIVPALALLLGLLALAFWALSRSNFLGAGADGRVTVYQGVPWELGGGVRLYRERYVSRLEAAQLSPEERARLFGHDLLSYDHARRALGAYEADGVP